MTSEPRQSALHALLVASALGAYMTPVKLPACAPFPSSTDPAPARYTRSFVGSPLRLTSLPEKLMLRFVPLVDITNSSTTPLFADPEPTEHVPLNVIALLPKITYGYVYERLTVAWIACGWPFTMPLDITV